MGEELLLKKLVGRGHVVPLPAHQVAYLELAALGPGLENAGGRWLLGSFDGGGLVVHVPAVIGKRLAHGAGLVVDFG